MSIFLRQIGLILRKDVKRLRWALGLYFAVLLAHAMVDAEQWTFYRRQDLAGALRLFLPVAQYLMAAVIAGLVIHQDSPIGVTSYWKSRPLRPGALIAAKGIFAACFLVLIPAVVDVAVLSYLGLGVGEWPQPFVTSFWRGTCWAAAGLAIATVTRSIPVYLLAFASGSLAWVLFSGFVTRQGTTEIGPLHLPLILLTSSIVIWRQYGRRRTEVSVAILICGFLGASSTDLLPWYRVPFAPYRTEVQVVTAGFELRRWNQHWERSISVRAHLIDADRGVVLIPRSVVGALELQDGSREWLELDDENGVSLREAQTVILEMLPRTGLPGIVGVGGTHLRSIKMRPVHWRNAGELAGRLESLEATLLLDEYSYESVGSAPLQKGAVLASGSLHLEVDDLALREDAVVTFVKGRELIREGGAGGVPHVFALFDQSTRTASLQSLRGLRGWLRSPDVSVPLTRAGYQAARLPSNFVFTMTPPVREAVLEELELRVWRPVFQRQVLAKIQIPTPVENATPTPDPSLVPGAR